MFFDHSLDIGPAPFGLAITCPYPNLPPESLKGQTSLPDRFHDRSGFDAPADTYFFELVDELLV